MAHVRCQGHLDRASGWAFPLPNGSITVFLRPENGLAGSLRLVSSSGPIGDNGAYLIVVRGDRRGGWVRRVPLFEEFVVFVDDEGVLQTDHALSLWRLPVLRLHYRMERRSSTLAE
jgi:hypothetical protein